MLLCFYYECLLSAAVTIKSIAIQKITPWTIIIVQVPIEYKDDNKNNNNGLPSMKVNPIENTNFEGNDLILSNINFTPKIALEY